MYLYILLCADGSYYGGITRDSLEKRIAEHQSGVFGGYTATRRPVKLVFSQEFQRITDAIAAERQIKGWRREKKEALIRGDYDLLPMLAQRAAKPIGASFETRSCGAVLRMKSVVGGHRTFLVPRWTG